jgi:hypothetical protein
VIPGRATASTAVLTAEVSAVADSDALRNAGTISACTRQLQHQTAEAMQQACRYRIWGWMEL